MTDLRDLNRDEWADKPYLIELRGGLNDGKRFRWPQLPYVWRQPEPAPISWLMADIEGPSFRLLPPTADYRWTDHVTDDGYRIYQFRTPRDVT
ncbi:MAG TPA: hypothetical protein VE465_02145 [Streptosporangiaceae bacterium]|nr:hypothetical protein [Streptosporangiaceae bacterium]